MSLTGNLSFSLPSFIYAVLYAVFILSCQWFYTAAMKSGGVSICSIVFSMGFIFPTVSGMIFWDEPISALKIIGIITVIPTIILSGLSKNDGEGEPEKRGGGEISFIIPLLIAMLASGALGILQKVHQMSEYSEERTMMILVAFVLASIISFVFALFAKPEEKSDGDTGSSDLKRKLLFSVGIGICYGSCNLLNTVLAGMLESAVFFPLLNVSMILLSLLLSIIFFKEKFTKRHLIILLLGILSIILVNVNF